MSVVLISGANRGIGLALARHYARRGDAVLAAVRNPATATDLGRLASRSAQVEIFALDVTNESACVELGRSLSRRVIDVVICNAGVGSPSGNYDSPAYDWEAWQRVLMTNVAGSFLLARAFVAHLRKARKGKLAFISSGMGSTAGASGGYYPYRASKAALVNLAANLAVDLQPLGIAVAAYHPGWVRTDMGGSAAPLSPAASAKGVADRIEALSLATTGVFEDWRGEPIPF